MMKIQTALNLPSTKKSSIFKFILALNCLLLLNFFAAAQKIETGNFFVTNYSRSFLNSVTGNWGILQDKEGVIYIGTSGEGILTYDGQKIRRVIDSSGLPKKGLTREVVIDTKNTIYTSIGSLEFGYVEKNEYGESIYTSLSKNLDPENQVKSTIWGLVIHNDTVFVQSEKAIYLYKYKKLLKVINFNNVTHVATETKDGVYLRVWGDGLYKFVNNDFKLIPSTKEVFSQNRIDANYLLNNGEHLLVSRNNGLWFLKKDNSLVKANSKDLDNYAIKGSVYIGGSPIKGGILPITTGELGLVLIDQNLKIQSVLNTENGLQFNHITNYMEDRAGDLWGTSDNIFKLSFDTTVTYFSTLNGLKGDVGAIKRINGKLLIKTNQDLYDFVPKKSITGNSIFEKNHVDELGEQIIQFDDQIITTNNYTIKTTKNRVTKVLSPIYRSRISIRSKLNPSLLFSSNYAYGLLLHQYKNGVWSQIPLKIKDTITCIDIFEPELGNIIITTVLKGTYLYKYDQSGQGELIKLSMDKSFTKQGFMRLQLFNDKDYLAYDTLNNFYSFDIQNNKIKFTGFNLHSFFDNSPWSYHYNPESKNGWMTNSKGLFKTSFDFANGFTFKQFPFYKIDLSELSSGLFAEGVGDNEVLWIGSQDDKLYRYFPELAIKEKHQNYKALIRAIFANGQKSPLALGKLPFSKNNLTFEVAYPVFGNESKTTFSYWLEGQDSSWSNFVSDFKKEYTNLKEGNYKFHVRAKDASGEVSEDGIVEFKISPPWYRTYWAYGLYLLTLVLCFIQFGKYQAKKSFLKAENERKNSELAAAKDLQNRLLPKTLPVIKNLDIAGYLRTSTEVGGDYYDFFEQPDGSLYAICGDATGHGTPSGMLVSITKAGIIGLPQMSPKDMLHELNRVVKKVDLGILRMSLNIALVKDNQITLSSAGMPPYFIYRAATKTAEEIQLSGVPLGSFNDVHFDQTTTAFNQGDILVIISDGLPEAPNLEGELFDYSKVQNLIAQYGNHTADEVIKQLMMEADSWLAGNHNPDDITLVVIKHK